MSPGTIVGVRAKAWVMALGRLNEWDQDQGMRDRDLIRTRVRELVRSRVGDRIQVRDGSWSGSRVPDRVSDWIRLKLRNRRITRGE